MNRIRTAVAVLLVATGLLAGSAVAAQASTPVMTSSETSVAGSVLNLLNAERGWHNLRPLYLNGYLTRSATAHNLKMATYNTMSHQLPGEYCLGLRITSAGFKPLASYGENIAWTSVISRSGALALEKMMYNEKAPANGHRLNILNSHYRYVGVAIHVDRTHNKLWLTTDFASHS